MSRLERQIQLSNLESVIEQKKREIQAKLEAQKRKETEEALLKIQKSSETPPRRPLWKSSKSISKATKDLEQPVKFTNVFSNDGSFLDQFRKLSKSGLKPDKVDVETLAIAQKAEEKEKERKKNVEEEKTQRQIERNMRERERELRKIDRDRDRRRYEPSPRERALMDSNIKLDLPPPRVVQLVPQVQIISPVVLTSMNQIVLNPTPSFTTNDIQLQATGISAPANLPPSLPLLQPPNLFPQTTPPMPVPVLPAAIPPPLPIAPYSIPPPSPIQVDSIPPPPFPPGESSGPPIKKRKKKEIVVSSCAPPPPGYFDEIPLPPSLPEKVPAAWRRSQTSSSSLLDSGTRHLAKMVATRGDEVEDILRVAHKDDSALRFLFDNNCAKYKEFRNYIEAYRSKNISDSDEESVEDNKPDPVDADDSDSSHSSRHKRTYDRTDNNDSSDSDSGKNAAKAYAKYDAANDSDSSSSSSSEESREAKKVTAYESDSDSSKRFKVNDEKYDPTAIDSDSDHDSSANLNRPPSASFWELADGGRPSFSGAKAEDSKNNIPFFNTESAQETKRQRKSRWGEKTVETVVTTVTPTELKVEEPLTMPLPPLPLPTPTTSTLGTNQVMLSQITRKEPGLLAYARQAFGSVNLSEEDWKRAEDHYKINLLYQNMMKKREQLDKLARQGKFKYDYDSDEDTEGGTWEHKLRNQEMTATQLWADELTRQAEGKHHIGDFLPPEELERFLEKYNAAKSGREPDLSDYKEFKLKEDNVGYKLLQKMGWNEGQGLGQEGQGMVNPVNKANTRMENQGLGIDRPDGVDADDDEYSAYRKRMMLAYRFRPNPLNNPRRPYY